MSEIATSTWIDLSGGAPLTCNVSGSDAAHVVIGVGRISCQLSLDAETMQVLAELTAAATAEMESLYQQEEQERSC